MGWIGRKQLSLKYLLAIVAVLAVICAWWFNNSFERSVDAVVRHGGAVSYNDQTVYVSFAPWMPSGASESWTHRKPLDVTADNLREIYKDLRILAISRQSLRIEFSDESLANEVREYFDSLSPGAGNTSLQVRRPGWLILLVQQENEPRE